MAENFIWPKDIQGHDRLVAFNPALKLYMCRACWDYSHSRGGCKVEGCQCPCYAGSSKGINHALPPAKGREEQASLPDVGTIEI